MIHRVYNMLLNKGIDAQILPLTTAVPYCEIHNIDFIKIEDFFSLNHCSEIEQNFITETAKKNYSPNLNISFNHTLAYHGIGLSELFSNHGYLNGKEIFIKKGRKSFLPLKFAEKLINIIKPAAIITTNVPRMELAFRMQGLKKNIKVFALDDLIGNFKKKQYISSNFVFVDNIVAKNNLIKNDFKGEIIISGNPVYEDLYKQKIKKKNSNNNLLILLQTGILNLLNFEVIALDNKFYIEFFENLYNFNFFDKFETIFIRFHPSMSKENFWDNIPIAYKIQIDKEQDVHKSIFKHSNVLGLTSTSLYEAYIFGCKIFNYSFGEDFFKLPMPYLGQINLSGKIISQNRTKPIINNEIKKVSSTKIIVNKIIDEVF